MKNAVHGNEKNQNEYSFYEIQKAFNEYWEDKKIEKGKGYKQFIVQPYNTIPDMVSLQQNAVQYLCQA